MCAEGVRQHCVVASARPTSRTSLPQSHRHNRPGTQAAAAVGDGNEALRYPQCLSPSAALSTRAPLWARYIRVGTRGGGEGEVGEGDFTCDCTRGRG